MSDAIKSELVKTEGPTLRAELIAAPKSPVQRAAEVEELLNKAVLDSYREAYKELADVWRGLETKAQGNIAVSGIFIAGVFAYIQKVDPQLRQAEKALLAVAALLLLLGVVCSIVALWLRTVPSPPFGSYVDTLATNLLSLRSDEERVSRLPTFGYDQIVEWRRVEKQLADSNEHKARYLKMGQAFLTAAVLTVGVLTVGKIFGFR